MKFCENPDVLTVMMYVKNVIKLIFNVVPVIVLIFVFIDFGKNVFTDSEEERKKNIGKAIKRFIACVIVFFVPTIVSGLFNILSKGGLDVGYLACFSNANSTYIDDSYENIAAEALASAEIELTDESIYKAERSLTKVKDEDLKVEMGVRIAELKDLVATLKKEEEEAQKHDDLFLVEIDHPDPDYKGHTVDLTDSQYLKLLRSVYGEQETGTFEIYVGLCQTIRDYIDYGSLSQRTYDSLGSFWILRGGSLPASKNTAWFIKNRPELIEAVEYVFGKGGSLAQRKTCFYIGDDDERYFGSYTAAYNRLVNVSCGENHPHDKVRLAPENWQSNWIEFSYGIR